jgi:hypothetical protein
LEDDHNIKRALALADAMPSMPSPTASQPGDGISRPTPEFLAVLGEEIVDFDLLIKASGASEQFAPVLTTPKPPTSWERLTAQMALLTPTETLNAASLTLTGEFGAVIGPSADVVLSTSPKEQMKKRKREKEIFQSTTPPTTAPDSVAIAPTAGTGVSSCNAVAISAPVVSSEVPTILTNEEEQKQKRKRGQEIFQPTPAAPITRPSFAMVPNATGFAISAGTYTGSLPVVACSLRLSTTNPQSTTSFLEQQRGMEISQSTTSRDMKVAEIAKMLGVSKDDLLEEMENCTAPLIKNNCRTAGARFTQHTLPCFRSIHSTYLR